MKKSHIILLVAAVIAVAYLIYIRGKTAPVQGSGAIGAPAPAPQASVRPATGKVPMPDSSTGRIQWYASAKAARDAYWSSGGGGNCSFINGTGAYQGQYGVLCP
jgi:hypothetical protein